MIARLCEAVLEDQKSVFTVSSRVSGEYGLADRCLSIPAVVGLEGVGATILPELGEAENQALHSSAEIIKTKIDGINI